MDRATTNEVLQSVASSLARLIDGPDALEGAHRRNDRTLFGSALFFAHLHRLTGDSLDRRTAVMAIDACAALLASQELDLGLYGGVAGLGWLFAHVDRIGAAEPRFDHSDPIDLLLTHLAGPAWRGFDLISGDVGLGVYFLELPPSAARTEGLRLVVRRLEAGGVLDGDGLRWFTPPALVPALQREAYPSGKYDLGVAHGTAGVVGFLSLALMGGMRDAQVERMLRESARWLLGAERRSTAGSAFSAALDARDLDRRPPCRSAWCYGDPGVAVALSMAAVALNDAALRQRSLNIARRAAARTLSDSGAVDGTLCHGAAGVAQCFLSLSCLHGDAALNSVARRWILHTLDLRDPSAGLAGFVNRDPVGGKPSQTSDSSFLQGASGVGLALLSALNNSADRSWDRMLLLS